MQRNQNKLTSACAWEGHSCSGLSPLSWHQGYHDLWAKRPLGVGRRLPRPGPPARCSTAAASSHLGAKESEPF